eukprot:GFUD01000175.1.p1 GENE.GFUD01000175.1~~GFUD01000175.1.p1  ORF type:complete len:249 (+),score=60.36 GFUD01000175.1:56-802(+)
MPVNMWNFFRAVGTGSDQKTWLSDNPQVEDGRIGGNVEFDQDVRDQYTDEVNHMMRRLRLNMFRAEDAMFMMRKRQWDAEDAEFSKEQLRRKKEAHHRRIKKNRERRLRREEQENTEQLDHLQHENGVNIEDRKLAKLLKSHFKCPICDDLMSPPSSIYQCEDGHILCQHCKTNPDIKECPECLGEVAGRNTTMENIATIVFSKHFEEEPTAPSIGESTHIDEDTIESENDDGIGGMILLSDVGSTSL